jgi:hypothetical protein
MLQSAVRPPRKLSASTDQVPEGHGTALAPGNANREDIVTIPSYPQDTMFTASPGAHGPDSSEEDRVGINGDASSEGMGMPPSSLMDEDPLSEGDFRAQSSLMDVDSDSIHTPESVSIPFPPLEDDTGAAPEPVRPSAWSRLSKFAYKRSSGSPSPPSPPRKRAKFRSRVSSDAGSGIISVTSHSSVKAEVSAGVDETSEDDIARAAIPSLQKSKAKTVPPWTGIESPAGISGISRSARDARMANAAVKNGTFQVEDRKYAIFCDKVCAMDPHAEVDEEAISVRHSLCGERKKMKRPYDLTRFKEHVDGTSKSQACWLRMRAKGDAKKSGASGSKTLTSFFKQVVNPSSKETSPKAKARDVKQPTRACPGITAEADAKVATYIKQTGAIGGGAPSRTRITQAVQPGTRYTDLDHQDKKAVMAEQMSQHRWRTVPQTQQVFTTNCTKQVRIDSQGATTMCKECTAILRDRAFRAALRIPMPSQENYIYLNREYRNQELGELYARTQGLAELMGTKVNDLRGHVAGSHY